MATVLAPSLTSLEAFSLSGEEWRSIPDIEGYVRSSCHKDNLCWGTPQNNMDDRRRDGGY